MNGAAVIWMVVTIAGADPAGSSDRLADEWRSLRGDWFVASGHWHGGPIEAFLPCPPEEFSGAVRILETGEIVFGAEPRDLKRSKVKWLYGKATVDIAHQPKHFDLSFYEGQSAFGKPLLGIYELQGDALRIRVAAPGRPRPQDFAMPTEKTRGQAMFQWATRSVLRIDSDSTALTQAAFVRRLPAERAEIAMSSLRKLDSAKTGVADRKRGELLKQAAIAYCDAGRYDDAAALAKELCALRGDNVATTTRNGNLILGRIALHDGRRDDAKRHLLTAGLSPDLFNFEFKELESCWLTADDLNLPKLLLEQGESTTVRDFLDQCRRFNLHDEKLLRQWSQEIKAEKTPNFSLCDVVYRMKLTDDTGKPNKMLAVPSGFWTCVQFAWDGHAQPLKALGTDPQLHILRIGVCEQLAFRYSASRTHIHGMIFPDLDPQSRELDVVPSQGELRGAIFPGIYEVHDDTLRVCLAPPGSKRPTEFTAPAGSGRAVLSFDFDPNFFINRGVTEEQRARYAVKQLSRAKTAAQRLCKLGDAAVHTQNIGKPEEARRYAEELLALAAAMPKNDGCKEALHDGNLVLGRLAVKENRLADVKRHLLEMAKNPKTNQWRQVCAPNMIVAKDLLERGELPTVLEFIESCRNTAKIDASRLDQWRDEVNAGRMPDFGEYLHPR